MIKILTQNGIENTNLDGARDGYFNSGGKDGISSGILNNGTLTAQGNVLTLDTCEMRIKGHRIVIDEPITKTISGFPTVDTNYQFIAKITYNDGSVTFDTEARPTASLIQDDILNGNGTYEVVIGEFIHKTDGTIANLVQIMRVILGGGGASGTGYILKPTALNDNNLPNVPIDKFQEAIEAYKAGIDVFLDLRGIPSFAHNTKIATAYRYFNSASGESLSFQLTYEYGYTLLARNGAVSVFEGDYAIPTNMESPAFSGKFWGYEDSDSEVHVGWGYPVISGTEDNPFIAAKSNDLVTKKYFDDYKAADGKDGTTFTPSVSEDGIISWTNDGGMGNPAPVNIKGPKGDSGVASGTVNSNTEGTSDTDGYTQQAVNKIASRPNLLINPDFAINQRGQESYTGAGYGVDRWTVDEGATLTPQNDGIKLIGACRQFYENPNRLWGKTVTLSFKTASGITSKSGTLPDVAPSANSTLVATNTDDSGVSAIVRYVTNRIAVVISATTETKIYWAKLEIGSVATAFTPPNIAEELPKCQRYYEVINNIYGQSGRAYAIGGIKSADEARFYIEFKQTKRRVPTITYSNASDFVIFNFVSSINCTSIGTIAGNASGVMIRANGDSLGTIGAVCQLNSDGTKNAEIRIDAEI